MEAEPRPATRRMIMIFGSNKIKAILRKATLEDLDGIKILVDKHKNELGFVVRGALHRSIESSEIIVAVDEIEGNLVGFVHYRHRKDKQTTLYNIVVAQDKRRCGIGKLLLDSLAAEAINKEKESILLKCPIELPANDFYRHLGFKLDSTIEGKKKPLNIWSLSL